MIVWINGAFGAGKTQAAHELHRRLADSFVFDPEQAGFYLRKNTPDPMHTDDFQDEPLWRDINYRMLREIVDKHGGVVIVPMTLASPRYYDEIIGRLRREGVDTRHVVLSMPGEEILRRLRSRAQGGRSWAAAQIERCLAAFETGLFENKIDVEHLSVAETAEEIARVCGLTLAPGGRGAAAWLRRMWTQITHIRWS